VNSITDSIHHSVNVLLISGNEDSIKKFFIDNHVVSYMPHRYCDGIYDYEFVLSNILPVPHELYNVSISESYNSKNRNVRRLIDKYGYPNALEFKMREWGVTSNIENSYSFLYNNNTKLLIVFSVAGLSIIPWLEYALKKYPMLSVDYMACNPFINWHHEYRFVEGMVAKSITSRLETNRHKWDVYFDTKMWYNDNCNDWYKSIRYHDIENLVVSS